MQYLAMLPGVLLVVGGFLGLFLTGSMGRACASLSLVGLGLCVVTGLDFTILEGVLKILSTNIHLGGISQ